MDVGREAAIIRSENTPGGHLDHMPKALAAGDDGDMGRLEDDSSFDSSLPVIESITWPLLTTSALLRYKVYEPVLVVGSEKFANIDIRLRVKGGGHVSQLYALRQAIAKGIVA